MVLLTEPVLGEPGTVRTEVESPVREEERGLLSSKPVPLAGPLSWTDLSKRWVLLPYQTASTSSVDLMGSKNVTALKLGGTTTQGTRGTRKRA